MTKFVVIAHPRSGSSFLCSKLLNKHDEIFCYSELFNTGNAVTKFITELGLNPNGRKDCEKFLSNFYELAYKKFKKEVIGFKLFEDQAQSFLPFKLISDSNYKIILLKRKNILQAAVSYEIALHTNEFHKKTDFEPFKIKAENIDSFISKYIKDHNEFKRYADENKHEIIEIEYETMFCLETINKMYEYLGVTKYKVYPYKKLLTTMRIFIKGLLIFMK